MVSKNELMVWPIKCSKTYKYTNVQFPKVQGDIIAEVEMTEFIKRFFEMVNYCNFFFYQLTNPCVSALRMTLEAKYKRGLDPIADTNGGGRSQSQNMFQKKQRTTEVHLKSKHAKYRKTLGKNIQVPRQTG